MDSRDTRLKRIARAYLWSLLAWAALTPVLAGQDKVLLSVRGVSTPYWVLLVVNFAWLFSAAIITPPMFVLVRHYPIAKPIRISRLAAYAAGFVPYIVVAACIRWLIFPAWDSPTQHFVGRSFTGLLHSFRIFGELTWDYLVIVAAAHAYEYFQRTRRQELERAELQQALAASELQALKSQLHPHFLFNTLHNISTLIDSDRDRAQAMIVKVSDLLRTALKCDHADVVPLQEELRFIEDYLCIERMRLEERLEVRWKLEPEARSFLVPQMILQPLVENAILHGISCSRSPGWIGIESWRDEHSLSVRVRNSVGGKSSPGMGLGLENTRARLRVLYGQEAQMHFELTDEGIATATLVLPLIGSFDDRVPEPLPSANRDRQDFHARFDR